MVQKALLNNAPGGLGVPKEESLGGDRLSRPPSPKGHPGDIQGPKSDQNISCLLGPSVPIYHHAGPCNGAIRC